MQTSYIITLSNILFQSNIFSLSLQNCLRSLRVAALVATAKSNLIHNAIQRTKQTDDYLRYKFLYHSNSEFLVLLPHVKSVIYSPLKFIDDGDGTYYLNMKYKFNLDISFISCSST